jgi:hypothetical protein
MFYCGKHKKVSVLFVDFMVYYRICFATFVFKIALVVLYRFSSGMDSAITTEGT